MEKIAKLIRNERSYLPHLPLVIASDHAVLHPPPFCTCATYIEITRLHYIIHPSSHNLTLRSKVDKSHLTPITIRDIS